MTTKFFDNKICDFKILLSWRFPRKQTPTPLKSEKFIFIVVSPSLSFSVSVRNPEKGAFARGALRKTCRKLRAKIAQNVVSCIRGRVSKIVANLS